MAGHCLRRHLFCLVTPVGLWMLLSVVHGAEPAKFGELFEDFQQDMRVGKYKAAERTALQLRSIANTRLKSNPKATVVASACLADVYKGQGRYKAAERFYRYAMSVAEKHFGPNDANLGVVVEELAEMYHQQGLLKQAEPLYVRAAAIYKKLGGPEDPNLGICLTSLGNLYQQLTRYAEAERAYKQSLAIEQKAFGAEDRRTGLTLCVLGALYRDQGRFEEALPLWQKVVAIEQKAYGAEHPSTATAMGSLGLLLDDLGRLDEAERLFRQALAIREKALGTNHPDVALNLNNLGLFYRRAGRLEEAEPLLKRSLEINKKHRGMNDPLVATSMVNLATIYADLGRYAEAEPLYREALESRERNLPADHLDVAQSLSSLGVHYAEQGHHAEAEPMLQRALRIRQANLPPNHPNVANGYHNLADLYSRVGRYAEAEQLFQRALAVKKRIYTGPHPQVAITLNQLAGLYMDQGRYAEAEPLFKQALDMGKALLSPYHPTVASIRNSLCVLYCRQNRFDVAEPLCKQALAAREKVYGAEHPDVAQSLNNLASIYAALGRKKEALDLVDRAWAIQLKTVGPKHPDIVYSANHMADSFLDAGMRKEAEQFYRKSLEVLEDLYGPDHPRVASTLVDLAGAIAGENRYAEAIALVDRAIAIEERLLVGPGTRYTSRRMAAELAWDNKDRATAIRHLRIAMDLAEQQRTRGSGGERERAQLFARLTGAFEMMVALQAELGDVAEAFDAIERSRAQSLVHQMALQGLDLLAGVPAEKVNPLRQRERQAGRHVAELHQQHQALAGRKDLTPEQRKQEWDDLRKELGQAQREYAAVYADIRNASPACRLATGQGHKRALLKELAAWAEQQEAIVLEYLIGNHGAFVLVVPGGGKPRLEKLHFDLRDVDGPENLPKFLESNYLNFVLTDKNGLGVLPLLRVASDPAKVQKAATGLHLLWEGLIPQAERTALCEGSFKRLVVIPDGPLVKFPFETLVVEQDDEPRYLLDVGPPVQYSPSATILLNLVRDRSAEETKSHRSVLTVGDPNYTAASQRSDDPLYAGSRYAGLGGTLTPLPHSGMEVAWVADVFAKRGIAATKLRGDEATEANVRASAQGRRVLHLACHGLVDQAHGNLFGALAFTPGSTSAAVLTDDGFLTLSEIYELPLAGTELAILSACETNYGPEQKGEGVWALSRGFLVAGSRRVVASNWLVDDEAAANLVSVFCSYLARAEKNGSPVDYAEALHKAKRWVRRQEKWNSPYYWGTFVLVGPN